MSISGARRACDAAHRELATMQRLVDRLVRGEWCPEDDVEFEAASQACAEARHAAERLVDQARARGAKILTARRAGVTRHATGFLDSRPE